MREKIRIGIIGCGWFGNKHLDYLLTKEDALVTALAGTNAEKLAAMGKKAPNAKLFSDPEELIASGIADAIVICVPPHRHGGLEISAAKKGLHMYVEKPLGIELPAAEEAWRAIRDAGVICSVGYQGRYENGADRLREKLAESPAGLVQGSWIGGEPGTRWWRNADESGGQVVEQSTHIVDMMRYLCGEVVSVYAGAETKLPAPLDGGTVDGGSLALLQFESGAMGSLATGCFGGDATGEVGIRIFCREGKIIFNWDKGVTIENVGGAESFAPSGRTHADAMDAFVEAIKNKNKNVYPTGIRSDYGDALKTFKLTLAIEESIRTGRKVNL